ncbi:uncharacterized protein TrAtP1_004350 [Trichoderma atroviride]|uniref:uncharacterized protein n=1 Tax=Hypocrea atroviridis TaxID=63577 RepID=UPI00332BDCB7|nr:hypothetical protein TrAtP1_004350 [Trichoderma atroviride]
MRRQGRIEVPASSGRDLPTPPTQATGAYPKHSPCPSLTLPAKHAPSTASAALATANDPTHYNHRSLPSFVPRQTFLWLHLVALQVLNSL